MRVNDHGHKQLFGFFSEMDLKRKKKKIKTNFFFKGSEQLRMKV